MNPPLPESKSRPKKFRYQFELCYSEPGGSECVGFQIDLLHNVSADPGRMVSDQLIRCESSHIDLADGFLPIFSVRESLHRLQIGDYHFRLPVAPGRGGNWYWQVDNVKPDSWAHLFNLLRRQRRQQPVEWDTEFMERIWRKRGSLEKSDTIRFVREYLTGFRKGTNGPNIFAQGGYPLTPTLSPLGRGEGEDSRARP